MGLCLPAAASAPSAAAHSASPIPAPPAVPAAAAMAKLVEGNARYRAEAPHDANRDEMRRIVTFIGGQHPFATVITCSDSRVPPEILFDQGLGELFTIRNAGNVVDETVIASAEYAVEHLGTRLVVVLAHTRCGAVTAALGDSVPPGALGELIKRIRPAAELARKAQPDTRGQALVNAATRANALQSIEKLLGGSAPIREAVASGRVQVVAALYDIHLGDVAFQGIHPAQGQILAAEHTFTPSAAGAESDATKSWHQPELLQTSARNSDAKPAHRPAAAGGAAHAPLGQDSAASAHTPAAAAPAPRVEASHSAGAQPAEAASTEPRSITAHMMGVGIFLLGGAAVSAVALHFIYPARRRSSEPAADEASTEPGEAQPA